MKNWKTTLAGILGVILMALGVLLPEKFDPDTQAAIHSALNEILAGIGALITLLGAIFAKDPE